MFTFVTSVRHPLNSNSYDRVWELLVATLRSVCAQSVDAFRVVVVLNEARPLPADLQDRVDLVHVTFDATPGRGAGTGMDAIRPDRGTKCLIGLLAARDLGADYVMFFDADDFVHRDIVKTARQAPPADGWFIDRGFRYKAGRIVPQDHFHGFCGTCNIMGIDLWLGPVGGELTMDSTQAAILDAVPHEWLFMILGSHKFAAPRFQQQGHTIHPFPIRAAVWNLDTGENHSDFRRDVGKAAPSDVDTRYWREASEHWKQVFGISS